MGMVLNHLDRVGGVVLESADHANEDLASDVEHGARCWCFW